MGMGTRGSVLSADGHIGGYSDLLDLRHGNSYRDLEVWQTSIDLAEHIYRLTADVSEAEIYGLCMQMRRAAVSVASNIAEGWSRRSRKEYSRFVAMAQGSNDELRTQL